MSSTATTAALLNATTALLASASSSSSSSTGAASSSDSVPYGLDHLYIAGWHVPLALIIVLIVLAALMLLCAVVGYCCQGALFCVWKTEEVVDDTVKSYKGSRAREALDDRRNRLALIKAAQRSDDAETA